MIHTIDAWVLAKHQYVANWVYTRDEAKSHYWLAAQAYLLGLSIMLVRDGALAIELGWAFLFVIPLSVIIALILLANFVVSNALHVAWLKGAPLFAKAESPLFRVLSTAWVLLFFALDVASGARITAFMADLYLTAMVCGMYWDACATPTRIERKEEQHDTDIVPELG